MKKKYILSLILTSLFSLVLGQDKDVFGIKYLMPSKLPKVEWTSQHWATGDERNISFGQADPYDTTGWASPRGDFNLFTIDGNGVLRMGGNQPRIYFKGTNAKPVFFRDVEFTAYFKRIGTDGASNGGLVFGVRTDPNGHGNDNCNASTYYFSVRYPGTWVFYKELHHPDGANGVSGSIWANNQVMPSDQWIGAKFLIYNIPGTNHVKLEGYIDLESNGDPSKEVTWQKVGEIVDNGNWTVPVGVECDYPGNTIITTGRGSALMRNTSAAEANYKMVSIREIDPEGSFEFPCDPVSASSDDGNISSNVLDEDINTRWSAEGDGEYIQFCFNNDSVPVHGLQIAFYNGNLRSSNFDIIGTINKEDWFPILENQHSSGTSLELEPFNFNKTHWVKALRIVGHGNTINQWNSITEIVLDTTSSIDCHGDINGTATMDNCDVCSGGNTGIPPNDCVTSTETIGNNSQIINAYPNPFVSTCTITVTEPVQLKLTDLSGKLLEQVSIEKEYTLGASLPPGVYLLDYSSEKYHKTIKIVKY